MTKMYGFYFIEEVSYLLGLFTLMDDPIKIKNKAAEVLIAKYQCTHEKSELRKRIVRKLGRALYVGKG
jgi:hypothetical protein